MKIKFELNVNDFWALAREREWLTRADAFQGNHIHNGITRAGNGSINDLESFIQDIASTVSAFSSDSVQTEDVAAALLTIVRLSPAEE